MDNGDGTSKLVLTFEGGSGATQIIGESLADGQYVLSFLAGNPELVTFSITGNASTMSCFPFLPMAC